MTGPEFAAAGLALAGATWLAAWRADDPTAADGSSNQSLLIFVIIIDTVQLPGDLAVSFSIWLYLDPAECLVGKFLQQSQKIVSKKPDKETEGRPNARSFGNLIVDKWNYS